MIKFPRLNSGVSSKKNSEYSFNSEEQKAKHLDLVKKKEDPEIKLPIINMKSINKESSKEMAVNLFRRRSFSKWDQRFDKFSTNKNTGSDVIGTYPKSNFSSEENIKIEADAHATKMEDVLNKIIEKSIKEEQSKNKYSSFKVEEIRAMEQKEKLVNIQVQEIEEIIKERKEYEEDLRMEQTGRKVKVVKVDNLNIQSQNDDINQQNRRNKRDPNALRSKKKEDDEIQVERLTPLQKEEETHKFSTLEVFTENVEIMNDEFWDSVEIISLFDIDEHFDREAQKLYKGFRVGHENLSDPNTYLKRFEKSLRMNLEDAPKSITQLNKA